MPGDHVKALKFCSFFLLFASVAAAWPEPVAWEAYFVGSVSPAVVPKAEAALSQF